MKEIIIIISCLLVLEICALAYIVYRTDLIAQEYQGLDNRINQLEITVFPSYYGNEIIK